MCHTQTQTDEPITTAGSALPKGGTAGAGPVNGDPLSSAIQAEAAAQPKTQPVTQPTKFAKLLSFIAPIAEGAAVGGFAGRGHSGGGFGAAQEHFNQKRQQELQQAVFAQNQVNQNTTNQLHQAQIQLDAARAQREASKPNFTRGGVTAAMGPDGKPVLLRQNPITGEMEPVEGFSPVDKSDKTSATMTDKGLMAVNAGEGTASPITMPGAPQSVSTPLGDHPIGTGKFAGATASPQVTKQVAGQGVPLMPPGTINAKKPKPTKITNRDSSGREVDSLIDENPDSPTFGKPMKSGIASRAAAPKEGDTSRSIKDAEKTDAEKYAAAAMDKFQGDPDKAIQYLNSLKTGDPVADAKLNKLLPQIRNHIRDRVAPGKKGKQPRLNAAEIKQLTGDTVSSSVLDDDDQ